MKQQEFIRGKVSVVTPVYNGETHLTQMLDSVLAQTYSEVEMILADDGSDDKTIQIAEGYRDKFANRGYEYHIVKGIHKSASGAINYGLPYVTGEYLIWPDSDDVLEPESIEKRVRFLEENPQYQCVRSQSYYFDKVNGVLDKADEKTGDLTKEDLFWDILEFRTYVCCGCYMVRSKPFFDIYPERHIPEYPVGQNFQMLLPFMYKYKCPTIQEQLYGVFVREGSHSRTPLSQEQEEKKFQYYEELVDEIACICRISDKISRQRILLWKMKRRYYIARQYGRKRKALGALFWLCMCGKPGWELLKEYIYDWRKRNRLAKAKAWLHWRIREKYAGLRRIYHRGANIKRPAWFMKTETWIYWRIRKSYAKLRNGYRIIFGWVLQRGIWIYWRIRIRSKKVRALLWKMKLQDKKKQEKAVIEKGRDYKHCEEKMVALTFDDGYQNTALILDKLKDYNVKATFFVCGDWLEHSAEEFRRIFIEGHEIGNHSYSHLHMEGLTDVEVNDEIDRVEELSNRITGKNNTLFRFPYGRSNEYLMQLIMKKGFQPVGWSVDSMDWTGITAEEIFRNVIGNELLRNGAIILLHTTGRHTVEALDLIIPALREKGYTMVKVSELPEIVGR